MVKFLVDEAKVEKKRQELKEIENYWKEKSASQISFFNNLLLTISIAFISIVLKDFHINGVSISLTNIDISLTLHSLSLLSLFLSIYTGLQIAMCRLYDFRITRNICLAKRRYFEKYSELPIYNKRNKYKKLEKFTFFYRVLFKTKLIQNEGIVIILNNEVQNEVQNKLDKLRDDSDNLGKMTWRKLPYQVLYFLIGLISFTLSVLFG